MLCSPITALSTASAITYMATPSMVQAVCGKCACIVNRLSTGLEEQDRSVGLAADGNLVEVFASEDGSWTIIYTKPGRLTCLAAVGDK